MLYWLESFISVCLFYFFVVLLIQFRGARLLPIPSAEFSSVHAALQRPQKDVALRSLVVQEKTVTIWSFSVTYFTVMLMKQFVLSVFNSFNSFLMHLILYVGAILWKAEVFENQAWCSVTVLMKCLWLPYDWCGSWLVATTGFRELQWCSYKVHIR